MTWGQLLQQATTVALDVVEETQCCEQQFQNCSNSNSGGGSSSSRRAKAEDDVVDDDGANITLSSCNGTKKSLFIGINYYGTSAELRGCINDVKNIQSFVVQNFGFPTDRNHMKVLVDNDRNNMPTRSNILRAFQWLKAGAQPGDSLFLHYSGHGGSTKDLDGDEPDGMDETLIPVDYEKNGVILDDEIHEILVAGLPKGVRLTAIMDCCHSGSAMDLPFTYSPDGNLEIQEVDNRKALMEAAMSAGKSLMQGKKKEAFLTGVQAVGLYLSTPKHNEEARKNQIERRSTMADVIQFSGCRDEQTSADANIGGESTGAMSWAFREAFKKNGFHQTYAELLGNVRTLLYGKYSQIPQMSSGHRMDTKTVFNM